MHGNKTFSTCCSDGKRRKRKFQGSAFIPDDHIQLIAKNYRGANLNLEFEVSAEEHSYSQQLKKSGILKPHNYMDSRSSRRSRKRRSKRHKKRRKRQCRCCRCGDRSRISCGPTKKYKDECCKTKRSECSPCKIPRCSCKQKKTCDIRPKSTGTCKCCVKPQSVVKCCKTTAVDCNKPLVTCCCEKQIDPCFEERSDPCCKKPPKCCCKEKSDPCCKKPPKCCCKEKSNPCRKKPPKCCCEQKIDPCCKKPTKSCHEEKIDPCCGQPSTCRPGSNAVARASDKGCCLCCCNKLSEIKRNIVCGNKRSNSQNIRPKKSMNSTPLLERTLSTSSKEKHDLRRVESNSQSDKNHKIQKSESNADSKKPRPHKGKSVSNNDKNVYVAKRISSLEDDEVYGKYWYHRPPLENVMTHCEEDFEIPPEYNIQTEDNRLYYDVMQDTQEQKPRNAGYCVGCKEPMCLICKNFICNCECKRPNFVICNPCRNKMTPKKKKVCPPPRQKRQPTEPANTDGDAMFLLPLLASMQGNADCESCNC